MSFVQRLGLIVPPCKDACPAGVDAARYIREIKLGRPGQSLAVIRERIPFPAVCANACFAPCEDACAYRQYGDPIAIRALKRVAVERGGDAWKLKKRTAAKTGRKVAVVGAGPAGLVSAIFAAHLLEKADIIATPGNGFGEHGEGYVRFALTVEKKRIKEAVDRIGKRLV